MTISSNKPIQFGVPQGSILGPVLFIIYINDMVAALPDCLLIQYADDSQILIKGKIHELDILIEKAEDLLHKAKRYFQINGLNINESKTKCMFIGSRQYIAQIPENTVLKFDGCEIEKSDYM